MVAALQQEVADEEVSCGFWLVCFGWGEGRAAFVSCACFGKLMH